MNNNEATCRNEQKLPRNQWKRSRHRFYSPAHMASVAAMPLPCRTGTQLQNRHTTMLFPSLCRCSFFHTGVETKKMQLGQNISLVSKLPHVRCPTSRCNSFGVNSEIWAQCAVFWHWTRRDKCEIPCKELIPLLCFKNILININAIAQMKGIPRNCRNYGKSRHACRD